LDTSLSVPFWIVATVRWWWTSLISTSWKLTNVSILCSCVSLAIRRFYSLFVTHYMPPVVGYLTLLIYSEYPQWCGIIYGIPVHVAPACTGSDHFIFVQHSDIFTAPIRISFWCFPFTGIFLAIA
jgi:hypothetical protein